MLWNSQTLLSYNYTYIWMDTFLRMCMRIHVSICMQPANVYEYQHQRKIRDKHRIRRPISRERNVVGCIPRLHFVLVFVQVKFQISCQCQFISFFKICLWILWCYIVQQWPTKRRGFVILFAINVTWFDLVLKSFCQYWRSYFKWSWQTHVSTFHNGI